MVRSSFIFLSLLPASLLSRFLNALWRNSFVFLRCANRNKVTGRKALSHYTIMNSTLTWIKNHISLIIPSVISFHWRNICCVFFKFRQIYWRLLQIKAIVKISWSFKVGESLPSSWKLFHIIFLCCQQGKLLWCTSNKSLRLDVCLLRLNSKASNCYYKKWGFSERWNWRLKSYGMSRPLGCLIGIVTDVWRSTLFPYLGSSSP